MYNLQDICDRLTTNANKSQLLESLATKELL